MNDMFVLRKHEECAEFGADTASMRVSGDLDETTKRRFELHLKTCAICNARVARQEKLDSLIAQLPVYDASATVRRKQRPVLRFVTAGLAAAAILVVAGLVAETRKASFVQQAIAADAQWLVASQTGVTNVSAAVRSPWLGFASCSERIEPDVKGVFICALDRSGPLGRAGAAAGDVLVEVDGDEVRSSEDMYRAIADREVGESIAVGFAHGGRTVSATITLAARPAGGTNPLALEWSEALKRHTETLAPDEIAPESIFTLKADEGIHVQKTMTDDEWRRTRLLSAFPFPFYPGGLRRGDVIVAIDDVRMESWSSFFVGYGRSGSRPVRLQVARDGKRLTVNVSKAAK